MAMTLPMPIPSSPSGGNSPASDDSNAPRTPVSPTLPLPAEQSANSNNTQSSAPAATNANAQAQPKRKPSRRANTAERRATHNAVERQRRETLNGRFLDLAALLPNLSQIRRPSKSSIVNSSIAHIHASRRHRLLAARELRTVKVEADALRRELNEWRDRAGLPRVEEPVRSDAFTMVLSGELEVIAAVPGDDDDEDGGQGYGGYEDGDDDFPAHIANAHHSMDDIDDRHSMAMLKNANAHAFAHNVPNGNNHLAHILPRPAQGGPMISSPTAVSFENPAMGSMYESHPSAQHFMQQQFPDVEKVSAWNTAQLYQQTQQGMLQAQRSLFTPPATSHGLPSNQSNASFADQAMFANFQRQQQQQMAALQQQNSQLTGHMFGSPERDDTSSVGSVNISDHGRARSGSLGAGSGYGSPVGAGHVSSPPGSYEMPSNLSSGEYLHRRMASGGAALHVNTGVGNGTPGSWTREADMGGMGGMMKQGLASPPITVGGGGSGTGFAMMM